VSCWSVGQPKEQLAVDPPFAPVHCHRFCVALSFVLFRLPEAQLFWLPPHAPLTISRQLLPLWVYPLLQLHSQLFDPPPSVV